MTLEPNKKKHKEPMISYYCLQLFCLFFLFNAHLNQTWIFEHCTHHGKFGGLCRGQNGYFYWWAWNDWPYFLASLLATLWMPSISNNVELWTKMQKFGPVKKQYIRPLYRWCFQSVRWYMLALKARLGTMWEDNLQGISFQLISIWTSDSFQCQKLLRNKCMIS